MTSLGYSRYSVLKPTNYANPSNSHFTDPSPQFSSIVGATTGCGGAGGSAAELNGNPGYNTIKQSGGRTKRRGNKRSKSHNKRSKHNGKHTRGCRCRRCCKRGKRSMRGGMSSLSPSSFSGAANPPYHQFMGSAQPASFNYAVGSATPLPLNLIGTAPGLRMDIHNNCGPDYGMVQKGLIN